MHIIFASTTNSSALGAENGPPTTTARPNEAPEAPIQRLKKDDCTNFLRLATFLRLVITTEIDDTTLPRVQQLLQDYNISFKVVSAFS